MPGSSKRLSPTGEPPRREEAERSAASGGCSQAEKRQQFKANVCPEGREQKKKMKRTAFQPTKEPKDKESPRMKVCVCVCNVLTGL